jgi:hypothetical protein
MFASYVIQLCFSYFSKKMVVNYYACKHDEKVWIVHGCIPKKLQGKNLKNECVKNC